METDTKTFVFGFKTLRLRPSSVSTIEMDTETFDFEKKK